MLSSSFTHLCICAQACPPEVKAACFELLLSGVQKKERETVARPSAGGAFVPPSRRAGSFAPPAARGREEVSHCHHHFVCTLALVPCGLQVNGASRAHELNHSIMRIATPTGLCQVITVWSLGRAVALKGLTGFICHSTSQRLMADPMHRICA